MEKLEAIEDNNKRVKALGNFTKPSIAAIFVVYVRPVIFQTPKYILRLDCIVELNTSGSPKNNMVVVV